LNELRFQFRRKARAFTLIEVMVSMVILLILAGSIGWTVIEMREKAAVMRRASDDLSIATTMFEILDGALMNCVALDPTSGGAGVRGNSESLEVVSRGIVADLTGEGGALSGVIRTRFEFVPAIPELRIARSGASGGGSLEPVSRRVERVRFRFHDGSGWQDSFDSREAGGLPVAVEVAIWFATALEATARPSVAGAGMDADEGFDPRDFEGFGAPMRGEFDDLADGPTRAPDRYRVFAVLDGPVDEDLQAQEFAL
jgi:prepilin-type N-terminal cleavage/methylation domain-containing protein